MICTASSQGLSLFLWAVALLVADHSSFATRSDAQQSLAYNFSTSEMVLSLVINQMTLLRMLNETPIACPRHENDFQELRDLKLELNETSAEVMNQLHDVKTAAITEFNARREEAKEELRGLKEATLNEVDARTREGKEQLRGVKELEAALKRLHDRMETALDEVNARNNELTQELLIMKEQTFNEVNATKHELKQDLLSVKEEIRNEVNATTTQLKQVVLTVKKQVINEVNETVEQSKQELRNLTEGWQTASQVAEEPKTYRVFVERVPHFQAVINYEELGGRLALPLNGEENEQISRLVENTPSDENKDFWIGANDKQIEGQWINSATGEPVCYRNFHTDQPDNSWGEDCAHVWISTWLWNDIDCDNRLPYVCEFIG